MENLDKSSFLEKLESKKRDCIAFTKKYESRNMSELQQYYEGAKWAFEYAIHEFKSTNETD